MAMASISRAPWHDALEGEIIAGRTEDYERRQTSAWEMEFPKARCDIGRGIGVQPPGPHQDAGERDIESIGATGPATFARGERRLLHLVKPESCRHGPGRSSADELGVESHPWRSR